MPRELSFVPLPSRIFSLPMPSHGRIHRMSRPPQQLDLGNQFKICTFSNPQTQFIGTTGALSSHLIIDKFEDQHDIHAPEMTFFQNTLVINHLKQRVSLVFTCADAIRGTIYPKCLIPPSTSGLTSPQSETSPSNTKPADLADFINLHPNHDLSQFIPARVQVKEAAKWQEHMERSENKPEIIENIEEVGDWTSTTLYQGQLYPNNPHNAYFFNIHPQHSDQNVPGVVTGQTRSPDATHPSAQNQPPSCSPSAPALPPSEARTSFIDHLNSLVPAQSLLTQASPAQISLSSNISSAPTTFPASTAPSTSTPTPSSSNTSSSPGEPVQLTAAPSANFLHTPHRRSSDAAAPPTANSLHTPTSRQNQQSEHKDTQSAEDRSDPQEPQPLADQIPDPRIPHHIAPLPLVLQSQPAAEPPRTKSTPLWESNFNGPGIDYALLTNKNEKIEFYQHIILFEDELHDHGISNYSIRIRVMGSCYYVLVRNFVRVDNVVVRIRDTRYFYKFAQDSTPSASLPSGPLQLHSLSTSLPATSIQARDKQNIDQTSPTTTTTQTSPSTTQPDYLIRETKLQEATFEQLRAMKKSTIPKEYTEEFSSHVLPVKYILTERIDLNQLAKR